MDVSCSIIIPTADRPTELARTLASLASDAHSERRLEILVIDGGDPAETREVVDRYARLYPLTRYIREQVPGRLSAHHRGALESCGEVLIYLDDDVEVASGWFSALRAVFGDSDVRLAFGPSLPRYAVEPPEWLEAFVLRERRRWRLPLLNLLDFGSQLTEGEPRVVQGLNLALRRQDVFDYGGFHPDHMPPELQQFQGDGERGLLQRLHSLGKRAVYHPGARVHRHIPAEHLTLEYFEHVAARLGIADSYTGLRRARGLEPPETQRWWESSLPLTAQGLVGGPFSFRQERRRIVQAYRSAFEAHRDAAARDAHLRSWIERPDYWDYRLPPRPWVQRRSPSIGAGASGGLD